MLRNKKWKPLSAAVVGTVVIALLLTMGDLMSITLMMAPFGASCVIVFVLPDSPLAKARNVVGGHLISTGAGLVMLHLFGDSTWIIALSVGLSILLMQLTRTVHPPAGADPLVVMLSHAGWSYLFTPVLFGAVLIALAAYGYRKFLATKSADLKS